MELELTTLNKQEISTTSEHEKKMRLSENATSMVFQMFTKNIYSNPIGSVVREIASNCFDSHVEAGVSAPVLIKKSYNGVTDTHFISFIDFGVGMSPERVENIYGVYFESTKRADNGQIGGFGIGGKTPLAYRRPTGLGEGEYDNSFFVITNFNGTKYTYCIYEGNESPVINMMNSELTADRNGTEVRIPVRSVDISTFEKEMISQLYYFENIVFEGFSDTVTNDYQILQGNSFLYRGKDVNDYLHICLGRVAYPIDYKVLGLSMYEHQLPVAIKLNIGDVKVTASRETLDYNEATIKLLKKKIEEVKAELTGMLMKQYENITTLEQYFEIKNNFGELKMPNGEIINLNSIATKNNLSYANFPYNDMNIGNETMLFDIFFETRMYGKKVARRGSGSRTEVFNRDLKSLKEFSALYYVQGEMTRKLVKQAYLKTLHPTRYYILIPQQFGVDRMYTFEKVCNKLGIYVVHDDTDFSSTYANMPNFITMRESDARTIVECLRDEFTAIIEKNAVDYDAVVVPQSFIDSRKSERVSREELKNEFNIKVIGSYSSRRSSYITLEKFLKFKGKIFYGTRDDERLLDDARRMFCNAFNSDLIASYGYYSNGFDKTKGVAFVVISKQNEKYMKYHRNAYPISMFFHKMLHRKFDSIITASMSGSVLEKYRNINDIFKSSNFDLVSKKVAKEMKEIKSEIVKYQDKNNFSNINLRHSLIANHINIDVKKPKELLNLEDKLDKFIEFTDKNQGVLNYISLPYNALDPNCSHSKIISDILQKVLVF